MFLGTITNRKLLTIHIFPYFVLKKPQTKDSDRNPFKKALNKDRKPFKKGLNKKVRNSLKQPLKKDRNPQEGLKTKG